MRPDVCNCLQTVVFLHGLGETSDAWDAQREALPPGFESVAVDLFRDTSLGGAEFTLAGAASLVVSELDRLGIERAHLCGLSLGAMVALQFVLDYPERVRSLTLAAGQVKPPRVLMSIQSAVMRLLPSLVFAKQGVSKGAMLAVLSAVSRTDFTDRLAEVAVPTLVLCGSKDHPNLPAAHALAEGISDAVLQILPGAGHQSHIQSSDEFAHALGGFLLVGY